MCERIPDFRYHVTHRLRHKLSRWRFVDPPERQLADRAAIQLTRIGKLYAPRVHFAVICAMFNGWATSRRMRTFNSFAFRCCVFGCRGNDELEHYVNGRFVQDAANAHVIYSGRAAWGLLRFFCLVAQMTDADLQFGARFVYCVQETVRELRHIGKNFFKVIWKTRQHL